MTLTCVYCESPVNVGTPDQGEHLGRFIHLDSRKAQCPDGASTFAAPNLAVLTDHDLAALAASVTHPDVHSAIVDEQANRSAARPVVDNVMPQRASGLDELSVLARAPFPTIGPPGSPHPAGGTWPGTRAEREKYASSPVSKSPESPGEDPDEPGPVTLRRQRHRAKAIEHRSAADFPPFFALTPRQYEDLKAELILLRDAAGSAYETLRTMWRAHQARYPDASPRFKAAVRQAYQRGHAWTISPDEYDALVSHPCVVCGAPLLTGVGLDRLDNDDGYTVHNVRPCCGSCNLDRGRKPIDQHAAGGIVPAGVSVVGEEAIAAGVPRRPAEDLAATSCSCGICVGLRPSEVVRADGWSHSAVSCQRMIRDNPQA